MFPLSASDLNKRKAITLYPREFCRHDPDLLQLNEVLKMQDLAVIRIVGQDQTIATQSFQKESQAFIVDFSLLFSFPFFLLPLNYFGLLASRWTLQFSGQHF